ncbi:hypothetical protein E4U54_006044, partial [Claviceps lovelessii]
AEREVGATSTRQIPGRAEVGLVEVPLIRPVRDGTARQGVPPGSLGGNEGGN